MKFLDFYNKLNEDKILKKKLKEEEGSSAVMNPNSQKASSEILKSQENKIEDIVQKSDITDNSIISKKDKEIPIVIRPVFPTQSRAELSSTPIIDQK